MLTQVDITRIKSKITGVLQVNAGVAPARTATLLPIKSLQGKLYEADVLATICERLVTVEGFRLNLIGGGKLMLKQKGGPINRLYPYFEVWQGSTLFAELFTDVYFDTLSYHIRGSTNPRSYGDYHELDIALIHPNLSGNPKHDQIMLAVECKNTSIEKSIIRELLGFRRELSFYDRTSNPTYFSKFPASTVNASPNSIHMLYCSDKNVTRYSSNCIMFGILLQHHVM
jgi:hypothetical protein